MRLLLLLVAFSPACFVHAQTEPPIPAASNVAELNVMGFTAVGWDNTSLTATQILEENLDLVRIATVNTGVIDRDRIFVLPEYAFTTTRVMNERPLALVMAQLVGDPGENVLPCSSGNEGLEYLLMKQLSCISRQNFVYLVAAVLEKESRECQTGETAPSCFNIFSTTIVTDKNGFFIAKYRRFNSLEQGSVINRPIEATPTTFTTASGFTFGLLTGNDLLFREPAQSLLRRNVTQFITNGAWLNTVPFEFSVNVFQGWIEANKVYLAAANYMEPERGYSGIGTYRSFSGGFLRSEMVSGVSGGSVAIGDTLSDLSSLRRRKRQDNPNNVVGVAPADLSKFVSVEVPLSPTSRQVRACHETFCCDLTYSTTTTLTDTTSVAYRLLVFGGNRTVEGVAQPIFLEQTCGLVACARGAENAIDCTATKDQTAYTNSVSFSSLSLQGSFSTNSVRPITMSGEPSIFSSLSLGTLKTEQISERNYTVSYEVPRGLFIKVKTFALTATDVPAPPPPPPPPAGPNMSTLGKASSAFLMLLAALAAKLV
ncbi:biotinidase-like [Cloeon dipterum]|uniref:biotinidase-like n=1 Tax=Cloeon dipterum TaxID=197152 RepID=UPI00321F7643